MSVHSPANKPVTVSLPAIGSGDRLASGRDRAAVQHAAAVQQRAIVLRGPKRRSLEQIVVLSDVARRLAPPQLAIECLEIARARGIDHLEPRIIDSRNPAGVLQPVPLRRNAGFNLFIFLSSLLVLLAAALAWPMAEIARRVYRQPPALAGRALVVRRLARIAVIADLLYLFAWFLVLKPILGNQVGFYTTALDPVIRTLQIAAIVPVAAAALGLWNAWLSVRSRRSWVIKAGGILAAAALLGVLWIAYVGGLASFTLNY